jgi:hypothetical protein
MEESTVPLGLDPSSSKGKDDVHAGARREMAQDHKIPRCFAVKLDGTFSISFNLIPCFDTNDGQDIDLPHRLVPSTPALARRHCPEEGRHRICGVMSSEHKGSSLSSPTLACLPHLP